jgi:cytochrome c nitrite reductase small subunit
MVIIKGGVTVPELSSPAGGLKSRPARFLAMGPFWLWLAVASVFGGAAGLGGFTFIYAQGTSYFSDNPETCINCHVMREMYDGWNHSSHKAVAACNDCHTPHTFPGKYIIKGVNGWNHSVAFTLDNFSDPIRIHQMNRNVALDNCLYCHGDITVAMNHQHSPTPTDCLSCHTGIGHGR